MTTSEGISSKKTSHLRNRTPGEQRAVRAHAESRSSPSQRVGQRKERQSILTRVAVFLQCDCNAADLCSLARHCGYEVRTEPLSSARFGRESTL
jgi:hypothetical protein